MVFSGWRAFAGLLRPSRQANERRLRRRGEDVASLLLRDATRSDVPALARLHVLTWNVTHAPLLVRGPSVAIRERQWQAAIARPVPGWFCLVLARPDGALVGFAEARASDHPEYGGELRKVYLLSEYQRLGLGRRLLGAVAERFLQAGITSMWLNGDPRNPSSRAWKALGARKLDADPGSGNYGWGDVRGLLAEERAPDAV